MSEILKQIAQDQRAENKARKERQAKVGEARQKKQRFQTLRDSAISFCHLQIPDARSHQKQFFNDAEKVLFELGKYLIDAGWADFLPAVTKTCKDNYELAFCELLRLAISPKTVKGSIAKAFKDISEWANGASMSDAAENVLIYLRDRHDRGGKLLPDSPIVIISSGLKDTNSNPAEEMNRVKIWESYVSEAESANIINKWQYARNKWNETHNDKLPKTKSGCDRLRSAVKRYRNSKKNTK
jgi:hypothetical protein